VNGCEANLSTDSANCGGCGRVCPMGYACKSSVCTVIDAGAPPPPDGGTD
jgi:hypothetical protein